MTAPLRPVYTYPDVEALLVDWLDPLVSCDVRTDVPAENRPTRFVVIRRVGGVVDRSGIADVATVTFEAWDSAGRTAAYSLAADVRARVRKLSGAVVAGTTIGRVGEAAGPALLPDPDSRHVRYTFLATIPVRGVAA